MLYNSITKVTLKGKRLTLLSGKPTYFTQNEAMRESSRTFGEKEGFSNMTSG
jgi:hypothetical protein